MFKLMGMKKRKKWQLKLQDTKKQVLGRCLANFSRVWSFRKKQERNGESPKCCKPKVAVVFHPTSLDETTLAVEIPEDLIVEEILHRLPLKSLVRFKSVSEEWKSLIESGYLADKHLYHLLEKNNNGIVEEMKISVDWSTSESLSIKFFSRCSPMELGGDSETLLRVPGSCNGIVCVCQLDLVYIYLLNPITRVIRTLTPPPARKLSVGFGIDVVTGTYKVVVFYSFYKIKVFDLVTKIWRLRYKTAGPMRVWSTPCPKRNPVFVNGSLFWLLENNLLEILVMDLHTEKLRTVSKPNDMYVSDGRILMWSLDDRLCVSDYRQGMHSYVWVLVKEKLSDDEKWVRTRLDLLGHSLPPLRPNTAWFSQTLVSPYQSSSSTRIGSRHRHSSNYAQFSENGDTRVLVDAPTELHLILPKMLPLN